MRAHGNTRWGWGEVGWGRHRRPPDVAPAFAVLRTLDVCTTHKVFPLRSAVKEVFVLLGGQSESQNEERGQIRRSDGPVESPPAKRAKLEVEQEETLLKDTEGVLSLLECPVCVDTMRTPVRQCVNGHCVCNACRRRLSSCPLCRGPLSPLLHTRFDALARHLRIPCMFRENGCKVQLKIPEREHHLLSCRYNVRPCPLTPCPWRGPFCDIRQHALACHRDRTHRVGGPEKIVSFRHSVGDSNIPNDDALLIADEEMFLAELRFDQLRDQLTVMFRQMTGGRLRVPEHTYDVSLSGEDSEQKVAFRNLAVPETDDVAVVKSSRKCFLLQGWIVRKIADHYGHVSVDYRVTRCFKEDRNFFGWLWNKYWGEE